MNINDIYSDFNFSTAYRNRLIDYLRKHTTIECGGYNLFDGSYNNLLHIPEKLSELIFFIKKKNKEKKIQNYLEVGFSHGICNTIFNKFFKFKSNVAIDIFGPHLNGSVLLANMRFKNLTLFCGDSKNINTIKNVQKFSKFDLIFIDGSHEYNDVKNDFNQYKKMIEKKGLIILHDINLPNSGSKKFWNEIKKKYNPKRIKEIKFNKYHFLFGYGVILF